MSKGKQSHPMGCACVLLAALLIFLGVIGIKYIRDWQHRSSLEKHTVIDLISTERHSREDLEQAVELALDEFVYFTGCTLNRLWYDPEQAEPIEQEWMKIREKSQMDVMVLFADFHSGSQGLATGGRHEFLIDGNTHYTDFYFLFCRDENGWYISDGGPITQPETTHKIVTPTPKPTQIQ